MKTEIIWNESAQIFQLFVKDKIEEETEVQTRDAFVNLISNKIGMKLVINDLSFGWGKRFQSPQGDLVTIVLDEWKGLLVESKNKQLLNLIQEEANNLKIVS